MNVVLESLYFFAPVYVANMAPVFAAQWRWPGGQPVSALLLGAHKTVRGFYAGILGAFCTLLVQQRLQAFPLFEEIALLDYVAQNIIVLGFLFGGGAMAGDAVGSFFKRFMGIPAGGCSIPLDQLDYVLGAMLFVSMIVHIPWENALILLFVTPFLHIGVNIVGYWMGLKKVWW